MVAREKSIWFGCMLAASLFVLVLAAEECKPIPKARIEFWLANPRGV